MVDTGSRNGKSFRIGDWHVEPSLLTVTGSDGQGIRLTPKAMAVLVQLATASGEVIGKYDLMDSVWGNAAVTDGALSQVLLELRNAFNDDAARPKTIETIRGVGVRLIPVAEFDTSQSSADGRPRYSIALLALAALAAAALIGYLSKSELSNKPAIDGVNINRSIAILPFDNASGSEADRYFVDGLYDGLISRVSRIGDIRTLAKSATIRYQGESVALSRIADELSVGYVLQGSARRSDSQMWVSVQLVETASESVIWANNYSREISAAGIVDIQQQITQAIAARLGSALERRDPEWASSVPTQSVAALEEYYRAQSSLAQDTLEGRQEALARLEHAVEIDPEFALGHAALAGLYMSTFFMEGNDKAERTAQAERHVLRSLELDNLLPIAHAVLATIHFSRENIDEAEASFEKAIDLSPNNPGPYQMMGLIALWRRGDPNKAISYYQTALSLDPQNLNVRSWLATAMGAAGQFDHAAQIFREILEKDPRFHDARHAYGSLLISAYGQYVEGIRQLREVHAARPWVPRVASDIGHAYAELEDYDSMVFWFERALAIAPEDVMAPVLRGRIALFNGDLAGAKKWLHQADPTSWETTVWAAQVLALEAYRAGNATAAADVLLNAEPELSDPDIDFNQNNIWSALPFAIYRLAAGESAEAQRLANRILLALQSMPRRGIQGYRFGDAFLLIALGDYDAAIHAYAEAVDEGEFRSWGAPEFWAPLAHDPRYQELAAIVEMKRAEQLNKLRSMEAAGGFPDLPVLNAATPRD